MSVPLLLAEFIMIYQLIADIPAEFTLAQTTAEIQRRIEESLNTYFEDGDECPQENMERVQDIQAPQDKTTLNPPANTTRKITHKQLSPVSLALPPRESSPRHGITC